MIFEECCSLPRWSCPGAPARMGSCPRSAWLTAGPEQHGTFSDIVFTIDSMIWQSVTADSSYDWQCDSSPEHCTVSDSRQLFIRGQGSLGICILGHWWSRSHSLGKLVSDDTEIGTFIGNIEYAEYAALTHLSAGVKASTILHLIAMFHKFLFCLQHQEVSTATRKWWWLSKDPTGIQKYANPNIWNEIQEVWNIVLLLLFAVARIT